MTEVVIETSSQSCSQHTLDATCVCHLPRRAQPASLAHCGAFTAPQVRFFCCHHNLTFLKAYEAHGVAASMPECRSEGDQRCVLAVERRQ